ncbi:glutaredoxin family protein [Chitinolyticbacter meiyuanensis]|uniref:glutaredoxin family protein n=1 Tax=Chitinolyticbacter meiyuanensis TaxID=682798 RepID=UPI0011E5C8C5|nr:glutaredoxin family protein [Chitinolyticbacter meiyuanensis]
MKTLIALALAFVATASYAKVYQWRDANGNVHYSDQPPPAGQNGHERTIKPNVINSGQPAKRPGAPSAKLVLYSARGCAPCDEAKNLLDSNQLPYDLQFPTEDPQRTRDLISRLGPGVSPQLPLLEIDGQFLKSWDRFTWSAVLRQAGFTIAEPTKTPEKK